jgi:hypothetical protein
MLIYTLSVVMGDVLQFGVTVLTVPVNRKQMIYSDFRSAWLVLYFQFAVTIQSSSATAAAATIALASIWHMAAW